MASTQHAEQVSMQFLPFLPDDNYYLKNPSAEEVVHIINDDLGKLLRSDAATFWDVVPHNKSLHICIDSYLRFKRRPHDSVSKDVAGDSVVQKELAKRVFMVLLRMVSAAERGKGAPEPAAQGRLLYDRWLMDVPKLMDICVLYGPANPRLTQHLLHQVFSLQPKYADDVQAVAPLLVNNLNEVADRVGLVAKEVLRGQATLRTQLMDAMAYLLDTVMTLSAFLECYSPAAQLLLRPCHGALFGVLATLHDRTLPQLARALGQQQGEQESAHAPGTAAASPGQWLQQLGLSLQRLAFLLIRNGYLMQAEASGSAVQKEAEHRGNEVISLLMAAEHTAADGASDGVKQGDASHGLLHAVNARFHLDVSVAQAMSQGLITLDDIQFHYLLALIGGARTCLDAAAQQACAAAATAAASSSGSSSQDQAGGSGAAAAATVVDGALLASLVQQVKDLLPDYGEGFIAACLHEYQYRAEEVINHLLEGSLPPALSSLDPQLASWVPPSTANANDAKGKAAANLSSWTHLATQAAASSSTTMPLPTAGKRAAVVHRGTAKALGRVSEDIKGATRALAEELQWEYDDEYDDSFDDLLAAGADGVADVEGDDDAVMASNRFLGYEDEPNDGGPGPASTSQWQPGPAAGTSKGKPAGVRLPQGASRLVQSAERLNPVPPQQHASPSRPRQEPLRRQQQQQQQQGSPQQPGRSAAAGPSGRGGWGGQGAGRAGAGGRGRPSKLWVLDGRIYNYAKEGAQEVSSQEEADKAVAAAKQAAEAIMGLGPGGNVPLVRAQPARQQQGTDSSSEQGDEPDGGAAGSRGSGREGGRGSSSRGRGSYVHKEKNKAAVANHHRKDRAMRKMGLM